MSAFKNDRALSSLAVNEFLLSFQGGVPGSSLLGSYYKEKALDSLRKEKNQSERYPNGLPEISIGGYVTPYLNEDVYAGVYQELSQLESLHSPYFAFFHLFSPHLPYNPRKEYLRLFRDGYAPPAKPVHPLSTKLSENFLLSRRAIYDRQVAQVDEEFGRLIGTLDKIGALANSYLIFTSDHGELFERGYAGHGFPLLYESVLHIPLLIHAPGQAVREDVYPSTSNADILPTLLRIAGRETPSEIDGVVLPSFGGTADPDRPIFSVYGMDNSAFGPLKKGVAALRKGAYKLIAYLGYKNFDQVFELYNLVDDPDELIDLSNKELGIFTKLKQEFYFHLENANKSFVKK